MNKQLLRKLMKAYNQTLQSNPLKTQQDHEDFNEVHIRLNDLKEIYHNN